MTWNADKPVGSDDIVTALTTYIEQNFQHLRDALNGWCNWDNSTATNVVPLFKRIASGLTAVVGSEPDALDVGNYRVITFTPVDAEAVWDSFRINPFTNSNTLKVYIGYSASVSNGGDFDVEVKIQATADGENPSTGTFAATKSTTVTPGANVNLDQQLVATITSSDVALVQNDLLVIQITIKSTGTHTGNLQLFEVWYEEVEA